MKKLLIGVGVVVLTTTGLAYAEDSPEDACKNAAELYADNDLTGALEEAKWCVTLLEQEKQQNVNQVFPDSIMGFEGAEVEHQSAMGFSSTVREYIKGDLTVTVTLSGGGDAMGGAMNAFAALAQYGGGKKTRIQRRTATINDNNGQVQVMVSLKSSGMLMFEAYDMPQNTVVDFAKAFPVAELDDSRQ